MLLASFSYSKQGIQTEAVIWRGCNSNGHIKSGTQFSLGISANAASHAFCDLFCRFDVGPKKKDRQFCSAEMKQEVGAPEGVSG